MRFKVLFLIVFVVTFVVGCFFGWLKISNKKHLTNETASVIVPANVSQKDIVGKKEIISYLVAKNFADGKLLDEDYFSDEEIKYKYELLQTGQFHNEEVEAKTGEIWLGLFEKNNEMFLSSTKLKINRVRDEIVDKKGEKTGKEVKTNSRIEPLFLLNNTKFLKEGKVETYFLGKTFQDPDDENTQYFMEIREDFDQSFKVGDENYRLRVVKAFNKEAEICFVLLLETDTLKQILHASDGNYLGTLYWIGDLDRDHKPDIFLSPWIKENIVESSLYLSREAKKDHLVKKVAIRITIGC